MITQSELKEMLHYNPETGIFTRLISVAPNARAGDIAGCNTSVGYISIYVKNKKYAAHRLAWLYMTGEFPKHGTDHINHIKDDNRFVNLREATQRENCKNQSMRIDNTSGVTGVFWRKDVNKWRARIEVNQDTVCLGSHVDKFEAICARMSANNKYGFHENHGYR